MTKVSIKLEDRQKVLGLRFDKLTIESFDGFQGKVYYWILRCDCSKTSRRSSGELNLIAKENKHAACRSCAQQKNRKRPNGQASWKYIIRVYKSSAKTRGYEFNLTPEQFQAIASMDCHYCGSPPRDYNRYVSKTGSEKWVKQFSIDKEWINANGIDRKDNDLGYTLKNCLPCCVTCNRMKSAFGYRDLFNHVEKIFRFQESKKT